MESPVGVLSVSEQVSVVAALALFNDHSPTAFVKFGATPKTPIVASQSGCPLDVLAPAVGTGREILEWIGSVVHGIASSGVPHEAG